MGSASVRRNADTNVLIRFKDCRFHHHTVAGVIDRDFRNEYSSMPWDGDPVVGISEGADRMSGSTLTDHSMI